MERFISAWRNVPTRTIADIAVEWRGIYTERVIKQKVRHDVEAAAIRF
jgi:hypothetical protein